ncbi:hypothetical protein HUJ05_005025 [Dendroctonus ponderosae]|nr:hypothetical protein HUJ05_005025 [Dendroctonus ponderosae]
MDESPDSKKAWALSQKIFPILNDFSTCNQEDTFFKSQFEELCNYMQANGLQDFLQQLIINQVEKRFRDEIVPAFWSYFQKSELHNKDLNQFYNAVKSLYDNYKEMDKITSGLELFRQCTHVTKIPYNEKTINNALKLILKATVLAQSPLNYQAVTLSFYETALRIEDVDSYLGFDSGHCAACDQDSCNCLHLLQETNRKLSEMNLLEPLVGQTFTNLSHKYIYTHIQKMCKDNYDSFITRLETWLHTVVIVWLRKMYSFDTSICLNEAMDTFQTKLVNYLYNSYTKIRINQLFNIVIEYPESLPALEDIRLCLPRTDLKPLLMKKLQRAMETRLLHHGVSTADILTAYVATIKSLKVLDPTGVLLESVTDPIHQYLREREDTVRCVMSSLTEEGPNDLAEELHKRGAVDENINVEDGDDDWETWTPDPIEAAVSPNPPKDVGSRRNVDIISMLVDIYGSNELFVNEYRNLLADRLLSQYTSDTEKEIRYLELLKLKFGDSNLHFCEVMLKDVVDSKRINQRIKEDSEYSESIVPLSTLIVSQQFWPPFKEEKLELHSKVAEQIKQFTAGFETLKGSRTLCWKNHLGVVNIEIELNDRTFNLSVSPMQATILMHFQDKVQNVENKNLAKVVFCDEDFEAESAMASVQDQKDEEFQNIWTYIVGMLKNLDSLPLDRIHHMLKMFAFQGLTTECSPSELKVFLDRKVRKRLLIFSNNLYTLPK